MMNPGLVDTGDFPPCINLSKEEILAIRSLTKYQGEKGSEIIIKDNDERFKVIRRDALVLSTIGRMGSWCSAYHARIGLEEAPPVKRAPEAP